MNIVLPAATCVKKLPIFVYVHGGSLLYRGANLPIFDAVRLVSQSMATGKPIIAVNFNYRVGLGGFLASEVMRHEMAKDGYSGCGNFGFTDQQTAFEWVQQYLSQLGGDVDNVTAVGESAGGISISNQLIARNPARLHRAVCMSGLAFSIPAWTMAQHQDYFNAVCRHFALNSADADIMDQLRKIPEQELADATPAIQGVAAGTGNPCLDGDFYLKDPFDFHPAPAWLRSYLIGDVYHEGVIFHINIVNDEYEFLRNTFLQHISDPSLVDIIFSLYDISADISGDLLLERFEHMCGDAIFKIPNYITARQNTHLKALGQLFLYHFDQRSRIANELQGTAYHAHELLYLFNNLPEAMNESERKMGQNFAQAWIDFAHGLDPWDAMGSAAEWRWKVWGPECKEAVRTEAEDEDVRHYTRFERILALGEPGETWKKWCRFCDAICNKRMRMGRSLGIKTQV